MLEVDERQAHLGGEQAGEVVLAQRLAGEDAVGEPLGGSVGPAQLGADEDELGADGVEGVHGGTHKIGVIRPFLDPRALQG